MEPFETIPLDGAAFLGQDPLMRSLWDSAAALGSSGIMTGLLSAIRSTGGQGAEVLPESSGRELLPAVAAKLESNAPSEGTSSRDAITSDRNDLSLFTQSVDPLTGSVESAALVSGSAKINFQPAGAPIPSEYSADTGAAYDTNRGFGWVRQDNRMPLSVASYTRDRNTSGVEQRLDTLAHMQYPNTPAAAWEYALPNGKYSVSVTAGDQSPFNSTHRIRAEGVEVIRPFKGSSTHKFELGTATVTVGDGKLTIDAVGGTNTKINYLEISSVSSGNHPSVTGSSPSSRQTAISTSSAVNVDVTLPNTGQGVDPTTLNTTNVRLYRTYDNALVPGNINTTGGGDAIVYQPTSPLAANMHYTYRISEGVKDESGAAFLPFSTTFTTGTSTIPKTPGVNFSKSTVYEGAPISTLFISPDKGNLYAGSLDGSLLRFRIDRNGNLTERQAFRGGERNPLTGRAIIGLAFNPGIPEDLYLWTTNNNPVNPGTQPADDFTSKITRISLTGGSTKFDGDIQDFIVGLPRSAKDHLSNSLVYGPDKRLYMTQGSNSAMGAPDPAWYNRPERLLSGAVLRIDQQQVEEAPAGGFNVQSETYTNKAGQTITNPQGNYNPNDPKWNGNAPVQVYGSGIRNAYDLTWHSNGKLYVPTNGSAAGGNTPNNPATSANEALKNVGTQNDYLFKVEKGGYYGHPNPKRNQYILNGGNPTSGVDPAEVVAKDGYSGYAVGTNPDPKYKGFAHDFGRNRSPNGIIEYKSSTFNNALKNKLLVVEYSGGDDILALGVDANGNTPASGVTQAFAGLTDPLDIIEDTKNNGNIGSLYVAELPNDGANGGRITLLRPA